MRRWVAPIVLAAVTAGAFAVSLRNGFVWDDERIIAGNPDTRELSRIGKVLLSRDEVGAYYRPLTRASYLVDYQLFSMDARGFHAVSVAIHLASVLLLYAVARRLLRSRGAAVLAALLLAIHPIAAEPVNFLSGRNNLLALMFALASVVAFYEARRRGSIAFAVISAAALFLGVMSKEPAAMVLPLLVLSPFALPTPFALRRPFALSLSKRQVAPCPSTGRDTSASHSGPSTSTLRASAQGEREGLWWLLLPHAIAVAAYGLLRFIALGSSLGGSGILDGLGGRIAWNLYLIPRYVALALFPSGLTIFHDLPARVTDLSGGTLVACALGWLVLAAVVALLVRNRSEASTFGLLWFALGLLPIANIVPIPTTGLLSERYFYIPAVGLWLIAADLAERLASRSPSWRRAVVAVGATCLVALGVRTLTRNLDWRDDVTLARSAVRVDPASARAQYNLGVALKDTGDLAGAERAWDAAISLDPRHAQSLAQLGTLCAVRRDYARAEAYLSRAAEADPSIALVHFNLARICELTGRPAEAVTRYRTFLQLAAEPEDGSERIAFARSRVEALAGSDLLRW